MAKAMKDMESRAKSEEALKALQQKLESEEDEKRQHMQHKEQLEAKVGPVCPSSHGIRLAEWHLDTWMQLLLLVDGRSRRRYRRLVWRPNS